MAKAPMDIVKMKQTKKNVSHAMLESEWVVSAMVIFSWQPGTFSCK